MGKLVSSSSDMMTAATSSGSGPGRVWSRLIPPCSPSLFPLVSTLAAHTGGAACQCVRGLAHLAQWELCWDPTGPLPSWEKQTLWVPLGPKELNTADEPW